MAINPADSDLSLNNMEIGLGAWAWGDRAYWHYGSGYTDEDIGAAFDISLGGGVFMIDTAEIYGAGKSERIVGRLVKDSGKTVFVATKFFPIPFRFTAQSVVRALRGSLERLGMDKVDLYQIHWPSPLIPLERYAEGLALCVEAGLARQVGVSNYNVDHMTRTAKVLGRHNIQLTSNQVEYNLLARKIERNGVLEHCIETGVRVIAYSPLAMGMLTGKYTPETPPPQPRGRKYAAILPKMGSLIALLKEIGQGYGGKTPGQVALNWVICKGALPIPGAKNAQQAQENLGATGWRLTPAEITHLDDASANLM